MADTGWVIAGTGANDNSYGTVAWSSPGNITADDGVNASSNLDAFGNDPSNYLKATNFGHAIPTGATIDGIEVRYQAAEFTGDQVQEDRVRLVDESGTIGSTDRSDGQSFTDLFVNYDKGGASDLWGDTWTESDIEDTDFGFVLATSVESGFFGMNMVDAMWTKIYYTEGGGGLSIPVAMNSYRQRHQSVA